MKEEILRLDITVTNTLRPELSQGLCEGGNRRDHPDQRCTA